VQHERGPRNSTIRRQMALFMKESNEIFSTVYRSTSNLFPTQSYTSSSTTTTPSTVGLPPVAKTPPTNSDTCLIEQNFTPTSSSSSTATSSSPSDFDIYANIPPILQNPAISQSFMLHSLAPQVRPHRHPNEPCTRSKSILSIIIFKFSTYDVHNYLNNPETVCETAARLLFMFVTWVKSIPAFTSLDLNDQLSLLEEGWKENFILLASQFQMNFEIASILSNAGECARTGQRVLLEPH
jgi:nuclear receptor subfamily 2 group E protein 1